MCTHAFFCVEQMYLQDHLLGQRSGCIFIYLQRVKPFLQSSAWECISTFSIQSVSFWKDFLGINNLIDLCLISVLPCSMDPFIFQKPIFWKWKALILQSLSKYIFYVFKILFKNLTQTTSWGFFSCMFPPRSCILLALNL